MSPSSDQVQPSTNQYCLKLTQYNQVPISNALYWPSSPKYQQVLPSTDAVPSRTNQYLKEYHIWPHVDCSYFWWIVLLLSNVHCPAGLSPIKMWSGEKGLAGTAMKIYSYWSNTNMWNWNPNRNMWNTNRNSWYTNRNMWNTNNKHKYVIHK